MGSHTNGDSTAAQLQRRGVEMNWNTFLVPYGPDTSSLVHALGFACRAAMTFGVLKPGSPEEARLPLAIFVEVAGRKLQPDLEPILERRIHSFLSEPMGVMHLGQRDSVWLRISKKTRDAGFTIAHLGTVLGHKLKNDFPAIVDKVQVTLFTAGSQVDALYPEAVAAYRQRDERVGSLTDENVDRFYSCALCQSYAPSHVGIITPERLGLCDAYNWLDGKAAYAINPHGATSWSARVTS